MQSAGMSGPMISRPRYVGRMTGQMPVVGFHHFRYPDRSGVSKFQEMMPAYTYELRRYGRLWYSVECSSCLASWF